MSFNHHNLHDLAGARLGMCRDAYIAARGALTDALSGSVDLRKRHTSRDRPVGGHGKRAIDIALAATALVLLGPMFLLIAALLHVGLGRPVFVAQHRIGFAGRRFTAYVFRTMPNDGVRNAFARCLVRSWRDPGLYRLPQLLSILRGDMSFVGPRSIEVGHPGPYCPEYFAARPGLFGMRQVDRSGHLGARRRAAHNRYYVRQWSIWLDLAVLARSFAQN